MRLGVLLAIVLILRPGVLYGEGMEETVPIGLRDAVSRAVRNNPTLAQAATDVALAEDTVLAARGLDDLSLDASVNWLEVRHQLVTGAPVQQPAFDDLLTAVTLTQPLPTGGRLGLRFGSEYSRTEYATDLGMSLQRSSAAVIAPSLQLTLTHPLLRGLGRKAARAPQFRAQVQRDAAVLTRQSTVASLLRDVVHSYWDLYYATRELAIRRDAAQSAREQLRRVRAQIDVGKQPPSAAAEVEVAIALRDESVLLAEQNRAERSVELERLLGQPTVEARWLRATDVPEPEEPVPDPAEVAADALTHSPQLALARTLGRSAQIEVDVTKSGLLPQLDLSFSGGTVGNASDAGTAFGQLGQAGSYSVTAGLVLQLPVQNRAGRGARAAALDGLHRAQLSVIEIRNQLIAAAARLCAAARGADQRVALLVHAEGAAALDLAAERARFETGRSTNFEVLRRQDEVAQVQLGQTRAQVEKAKALAAMEALTGRIGERFGVKPR